MINKINPFHELYVTESFGSESFVKLFSEVLMDPVAALFKPGNVILKGLPGTGKTMMLSLLEPEIRVAYKRCRIPFPIPKNVNKFIGAGINLIRSSVADFGQRPVSNDKEANELAIYFADFVNYWIIRDILNSIKILGHELSDEIGIDLDEKKLHNFINELKYDDCWFGYLDTINSFEEFERVLKDRIVTYRSYLHFNLDTVPERIATTKTAIGEPISRTVQLLRKHNIISNDVHVFIRIDQYEELSWLDKVSGGIGKLFKSVINKLLASRDASVSYRVGTRPFAWNEDTREIFGTTARLEVTRNYLEISIDDVLRRHEDRKTYLFPKFAEDIFSKRLKFYGFSTGTGDTEKGKVKSILKEVFGNGLTSEEKALKYVQTNREKAVSIDPSWPEPWKNYLLKLTQKSPLSARLAEGWARQKGKESIVENIPLPGEEPWEAKAKQYWKKERIEQALIQIASRNNQQLIWEGKDDILDLSGGNILVFLNLCQEIWEVWMRDSDKDETDQLKVRRIDTTIQTLGILHASTGWFNKISAVIGGKERRQFIRNVGVELQRMLLEDKSMSYPGRNGFSLLEEAQERDNVLNNFLGEASDYGDLQERPHTSKDKNKKKRVKWYLHPILTPYFKIPAVHTKEPYYAKVEEVRAWLELPPVDDSQLPVKATPALRARTPKSNNGQTSLF